MIMSSFVIWITSDKIITHVSLKSDIFFRFFTKYSCKLRIERRSPMRKRILAALLCLILMVPAAMAASIPDVSVLTDDEIRDLDRQLLREMWRREYWANVYVPSGMYTVGKDIPEGEWKITAMSGEVNHIIIGDKVNATGAAFDKDAQLLLDVFIASVSGTKYDDTAPEYITLTLTVGMYVYIDRGTVAFSRAKAPDFSFK